MKLDAHVHSIYSGHSTLRPLGRVMRESVLFRSDACIVRRGCAAWIWSAAR